MNVLINLVRTQPARLVGVVIAFLALLSAFGLSLGDKQTAALMGVIYAIFSLVGGEIVRANVTPTGNVPDVSALTDEPAPVSTEDQAWDAETNAAPDDEDSSLLHVDDDEEPVVR